MRLHVTGPTAFKGPTGKHISCEKQHWKLSFLHFLNFAPIILWSWKAQQLIFRS